jgi:tetratricopeptide (TPR) repeat protein
MRGIAVLTLGMSLLGCAPHPAVTAPTTPAMKSAGSMCTDVDANLEDELDADYDAGRRDDALERASVALDTCERDPKATFLDRERVRARHAGTLIGVGQVDQGEAEARRAFDALEAKVGLVHRDTALALSEIASATAARRDYVRLRFLEAQVLSIYEKVGRPKDLAGALSSYAVLVARTGGDRAEAVSLGERAIAVALASYPMESREVASAIGALGEVYRAQGDAKSAEPLLVKALAMRERILGPDHGAVASSTNNLAALYHYTLGDLAKAEPLYRRTLAQYRRFMPANHPNLGQVLLNLGALLCQRGQCEEGRALFDEGAAIMEKNGGKDNVELRRSREWLKKVEATQPR